MKKALNIIYYTLTGLLGLITIILVIAGISSFIRQEPLNIFGYGMAPVGSGSMEPEIKKGDFVFTNHNYSFDDIEINDDIIFVSTDQHGRRIVVVHRVIEIGTEGQLITKGINNMRVDDNPVYDDNYLGKVVGVSALLGLGNILIDSRVTIVFILVIALIIILAYQISDYYRRKQKLKYEKQLEEYKQEVLEQYQNSKEIENDNKNNNEEQ